jgi:hypothetical protein
LLLDQKVFVRSLEIFDVAVIEVPEARGDFVNDVVVE